MQKSSADRIEFSVEMRNEDHALMKKELQAAIALNPEYADAYNLLALAQASEGNFVAAINSETRAFQLSHKEIYALNQADFCARQGLRDQAQKLLQKLSQSQDPSIAAEARSRLATLKTP